MTNEQAAQLKPLLNKLEAGGALIAQAYPERRQIRVGLLSRAQCEIVGEALARALELGADETEGAVVLPRGDKRKMPPAYVLLAATLACIALSVSGVALVMFLLLNIPAVASSDFLRGLVGAGCAFVAGMLGNLFLVVWRRKKNDR